MASLGGMECDMHRQIENSQINNVAEIDDRRELLRQKVVAAIDEIASIRCPDPAAVDAFLSARLAMHTLRDVWLRNM